MIWKPPKEWLATCLKPYRNNLTHKNDGNDLHHADSRDDTAAAVGNNAGEHAPHWGILYLQNRGYTKTADELTSAVSRYITKPSVRGFVDYAHKCVRSRLSLNNRPRMCRYCACSPNNRCNCNLIYRTCCLSLRKFCTCLAYFSTKPLPRKVHRLPW